MWISKRGPFCLHRNDLTEADVLEQADKLSFPSSVVEYLQASVHRSSFYIAALTRQCKWYIFRCND